MSMLEATHTPTLWEEEARSRRKYVITIRFEPELRDRLDDALFKLNLLCREQRDSSFLPEDDRKMIDAAEKAGDYKLAREIRESHLPISQNRFCREVILQAIRVIENKAGNAIRCLKVPQDV